MGSVSSLPNVEVIGFVSILKYIQGRGGGELKVYYRLNVKYK